MSIQAVSAYIVERLGTIRHTQGADSVPVPVYGPGPSRKAGKEKFPSITVVLEDWEIDAMLTHPAQQVFIPSEERVTVTVSAYWGGGLVAEIVGTEIEPFAVLRGVNDVLSIRIGKDDQWQEPQTAHLVSGAPSADNVCRALNVWLKGVVSWPRYRNRVAMACREPGWDLEILPYARSAAPVLGLPEGVVSHLQQTGPASFTVKASATAVKLRYCIEVRAVDDLQRHALEMFVMDLFPDGHWPRISDTCAPVFVHDREDYGDEPELPKFSSRFRCGVSQVWVDRLTSFPIEGIRDVTMEFDA